MRTSFVSVLLSSTQHWPLFSVWSSSSADCPFRPDRLDLWDLFGPLFPSRSGATRHLEKPPTNPIKNLPLDQILVGFAPPLGHAVDSYRSPFAVGEFASSQIGSLALALSFFFPFPLSRIFLFKPHRLYFPFSPTAFVCHSRFLHHCQFQSRLMAS